jgi:MerR family transcriptional regulator, light-induced transcriptional regulator
MTQFSIKDLADFSGIKPHTIRIWEQRFNFLKPNRTETARRVYNAEELNLFLEVMLLNQNGYKISKIAGMSMEDKLRLIEKMDESQQKLRTINELIIAMAEMDKDKFEQILDISIRYWGLESTIMEVLLPFCDKTGLLQDPENKYYVENIAVIEHAVRQKIYLGIEYTVAQSQRDKTVLLLHTPADQQHLNLLFLHYLMKGAGFQTLHISNTLSFDHIKTIIGIKKPDYLVIHPSQKEKRGNLSRFLQHVSELFPSLQFISIGNPVSLKGIDMRYRHAADIKEGKSMIM